MSSSIVTSVKDFLSGHPPKFSSNAVDTSPTNSHESTKTSKPGQMSGTARGISQGSRSQQLSINLEANDDEDNWDPAPKSTEYMRTRSGNTKSERISSSSSKPIPGERRDDGREQDIARLLGPGGACRRDDGVTLIQRPVSKFQDAARQTSQKKFGAFSPRNDLDSPSSLHPGRSLPRQPPRYLQTRTSTGSNVPSSNSRRTDQNEGPNRKKRRTGESPTMIDITDDGDDEPLCGMSGARAVGTAKGSSTTTNTVHQSSSQKPRPNGVSPVHEYHAVENMIASFKKPGRPKNPIQSDKEGTSASPLELPSNESAMNISTVSQVRQHRTKSSSHKQSTTSPYFPRMNGIASSGQLRSSPVRENADLRYAFITSDGKRRNSIVGVSDDELQGSPTVRNTIRQAAAINVVNDDDTEMLDNNTQMDRVEIVSRPARSNIPQSKFTRSPKKTSPPSGLEPAKKRIKRERNSHEYQVEQFQWGEFQISREQKGLVAIDAMNRRFECYLEESLIGPDALCEVPIDKVQSIDHGHDPSGKARIQLSASSNRNEAIFVEFIKHKKMMDFMRDLQSFVPGIRVHARESDWMDNLFQRKKAAPALSANLGSRDLPASDLRKFHYDKVAGDETVSQHGANESRPRNKLKDNLGGEDGRSAEPSIRETRSGLKPSIITGKDRAGGMEDFYNHESRSGIDRTLAMLKPREPATYHTPTRATRSNTKREDSILGSLLSSLDQPKIDLGPRWKKPLIFPKEGKKKTEVEFTDLDRLQEYEFLNDNLVGFYMRYLEYYLEQDEPDLSSKIYIFNSFFYERLTQTNKSKKGVINYEAVSKWTSKVDIFGYDFVVVPINESAHWYLAIICNLRNLDRRAATPPGQDIEDIESDNEDARGDGDNKVSGQKISETLGADEREPVSLGGNTDDSNEEARDSFTRMTLGDGEAVQLSEVQGTDDEALPGAGDEQQEWPSEGENPDVAMKSPQKPTPAKNIGKRAALTESKSSKTPPSRKRGHKPKRKSAGRTFPPDSPAIITFDSLISSRPTTIKILKEYLREEANAKRGMKVEDGDLQGINAKGIPTQQNYSDCGLYLLAYLEAFLNNPKKFTADIMLREMHEETWSRLNGYDLRQRLLKIIQRLHREQEIKTTPDREQDKAKRDECLEGYTMLCPKPEPSPQEPDLEISSEEERVPRPQKQPSGFDKKIKNRFHNRKSDASNIEGESINPISLDAPPKSFAMDTDYALGDQLQSAARDADPNPTESEDQATRPTSSSSRISRAKGRYSVDTPFVRSPDRSYREALSPKEDEDDGENEDDSVQLVEATDATEATEEDMEAWRREHR